MNERLKELEKQSVFYHEDEEYWDFDRRKFARLIVKECADIALNHPAKLPSNDWKGVDVPLDTSNRIKQHFGVEE